MCSVTKYGLIKIFQQQSCHFISMNEMWCNSLQICNHTTTTPISGYMHRCLWQSLSYDINAITPLHQIIAYIWQPTDIRAPAAPCMLFLTILIICLCADLSVTVAPLLHIVRGTSITIHHLVYYYELCISLLCQTSHACVVWQFGSADDGRGMLMDASPTASWQWFILW